MYQSPLERILGYCFIEIIPHQERQQHYVRLVSDVETREQATPYPGNSLKEKQLKLECQLMASLLLEVITNPKK